MRAKMKKGKKVYPEDEEAVNQMLETWDIVRCKICGKEISMLDARLVKDGKYFICKAGH